MAQTSGAEGEDATQDVVEFEPSYTAGEVRSALLRLSGRRVGGRLLLAAALVVGGLIALRPAPLALVVGAVVFTAVIGWLLLVRIPKQVLADRGWSRWSVHPDRIHVLGTTYESTLEWSHFTGVRLTPHFLLLERPPGRPNLFVPVRCLPPGAAARLGAWARAAGVQTEGFPSVAAPGS